jgi:hypothetical protein
VLREHPQAKSCAVAVVLLGYNAISKTKNEGQRTTYYNTTYTYTYTYYIQHTDIQQGRQPVSVSIAIATIAYYEKALGLGRRTARGPALFVLCSAVLYLASSIPNPMDPVAAS